MENKKYTEEEALNCFMNEIKPLFNMFYDFEIQKDYDSEYNDKTRDYQYIRVNYKIKINSVYLTTSDLIELIDYGYNFTVDLTYNNCIKIYFHYKLKEDN